PKAYLCLRLLVAFALLAACSTLVIPPAAPENARSVFLLEHGQHASLVLPGKNRGVVRYSYGDWDYYALGKKGISSGLRALQGPTRAGLGRRELAATATEEGVRASVRIDILAVHELKASAPAIENLRGMLDGIYEANKNSLIYNSQIDLEFVHHPVPYSAQHNSNRVVADWLRVLGCKVEGPTFVPNWKFERPKDARHQTNPKLCRSRDTAFTST
ncbi:MAG: hypothetical protein ACREV0_08895, partial [Burkholderiales bacterium]